LSARSIYIASTGKLSGKSSITISLALKAKELGMKIGYFKPVGRGSSLNRKNQVIDKDVEIIKDIMRLEEDIELICPIVLGKGDFLEEFLSVRNHDYSDAIIRSYEKISEDKDLVLVEGPDTLHTGSFLNLPVPRIAEILSSKVVIVAQLIDDSIVDELIHARDYCLGWDVSILGVILNRITQENVKKTRTLMKPYLKERGIDILGTIPENSVLGALTIKEIYEEIGGQILAGKDGMNKTVQSFLIGAMTIEGAMKYFRRAKDKLIVTGGDRTDMILAALETNASALILTGNLYPSVKILPRADKLDIPVILVPYDTFTTLQLIQKIIGRIKPRDEKRITIAKKLLEENVVWKKIISP
jgi:BioD-like phosphotransacetylase family protein